MLTKKKKKCSEREELRSRNDAGADGPGWAPARDAERRRLRSSNSSARSSSEQQIHKPSRWHFAFTAQFQLCPLHQRMPSATEAGRWWIGIAVQTHFWKLGDDFTWQCDSSLQGSKSFLGQANLWYTLTQKTNKQPAQFTERFLWLYPKKHIFKTIT